MFADDDPPDGPRAERPGQNTTGPAEHDLTDTKRIIFEAFEEFCSDHANKYFSTRVILRRINELHYNIRADFNAMQAYADELSKTIRPAPAERTRETCFGVFFLDFKLCERHTFMSNLDFIHQRLLRLTSYR